MDIGAELRQAREQRGFSLEEVSRRTKITLPALRAIENNEVERLPGGIFTRGFVKAYAREVGLDPQDLARRYLAQFEPVAVLSPVDSAPPVPPVDDQRPRDTMPAAAPIALARNVTIIAVVVLIAVSYLELTRPHGSSPPSRIESSRSVEIVATPERSQPKKSPPARAETGTTGSLAAVPGPPASDSILRVDLHPPETCWVSATADGRRITYRLMLAGERQAIEARDELVLRVGDAGRFAFSINGASGAPLGPAGQPATVRLTPRNYAKFVRR